MYTPDKLPAVDTLNSHFGFYVAVFCMVIYIWIAWTSYDDLDRNTFALPVFTLVVVGCISWNTGSITVPKNTPVIGVMQGFVAEGEAYTERSGKTTVRREVHRTYVVYEIDSGLVYFQAVQGTSYPKFGVFYKN